MQDIKNTQIVQIMEEGHEGHYRVWAAIDGYASSMGYSCSGLARASGLDPTTFNKSKRFSPHGKQRWPSMQSIYKMLEATKRDFEDFVRFIPPKRKSKG